MAQRGNSTWLVVGSSPKAKRYFDAALRVADMTITTNSGWHLFRTAEPTDGKPHEVIPDFYYLADSIAIGIHDRAATWMQRRGTRIVTKANSPIALGLPDLDENMIVRLPLMDRGDSTAWNPGEYVNNLSGAIITQFAANRGPRRVILIGMDGYRSSEAELVRDSFDGRLGKATGQQLSRWQGSLLQSIVSACPGVEFLICGTPNYELTGPNVANVGVDELIELQHAAT